MKTRGLAPIVHYPPVRHPALTTTADEYERYSLFYLGGPTQGVDNWQKQAVDIIAELTTKRLVPTNIFNPRHDNPDMNAGLDWETYRIADAIGAFTTRKCGKDSEGITNTSSTTLGGALFWFPRQTIETPPGYSFATQSLMTLARTAGHYIQMDKEEATRYADEETQALPRIIIGIEHDFDAAHPQEAYLIRKQADDLDIPVWQDLSWACKQLTHEEV